MIKLRVNGMGCEHCAQAVGKALAAVPGVTKVVEVNLEKGEALIEGEPEVSTLLAAVEQEGYQAEPVQ